MNFAEAVNKLNENCVITRRAWNKEIFFALESNNVVCYRPVLKHYQYTSDIINSDGWIIEGDEEKKEYKFYEIIPLLKKGENAKLNEKSWNNSYIYYDMHETKRLILHTIEKTEYMPEFEAFIASDWYVIDDYKDK